MDHQISEIFPSLRAKTNVFRRSKSLSWRQSETENPSRFDVYSCSVIRKIILLHFQQVSLNPNHLCCSLIIISPNHFVLIYIVSFFLPLNVSHFLYLFCCYCFFLSFTKFLLNILIPNNFLQFFRIFLLNFSRTLWYS